jgi:hypothetical protein
MSLTLGKYYRDNNSISYAGLKYEKYLLPSSGNYIHLNINVGSSYTEKQYQDFRFLSNLEIIGKLKSFENGSPFRHLFNLSVAQTLKNKFNEEM